MHPEDGPALDPLIIAWREALSSKREQKKYLALINSMALLQWEI
jgi:hypothetical protein